jgi:DNA polymerase-3 subunit beta
VMLDLRGADQPATVRSADEGDLTTLVMPCRPDPPGTTSRTPRPQTRKE